MATHLLHSIRGVFNDDMIRRAASTLGEHDAGISKAVNAGIPALLSGIISTAAYDGGNNLLMLSKTSAASGILDNPSGLFGGPNSSELISNGGNMLSGLFGSKSGGLASIIGNYAGVMSSTSHALLSTIASVSLAFIGRHAVEHKMNGTSLLGWLGNQEPGIRDAIPSGLNISGLFDHTHKAPQPVRKTARVEPKKGNKMVLPLLLAVAGIALLWYLMKGCNKQEEMGPATTAAVIETAPATTVTPAKPARESTKVKLPDGTEIEAYKGGIEDQLVTFLNNPGSKIGKDVWFDFDNLTFESGSATITSGSQVQVNNIAVILKAYPKVKIKIGGYTDVTGDSVANRKLSQDRADAVVTAVKAAGANSNQLLGGEGYGSQFAKAPAGAPDSQKEKDRRIAVSVREK